MRVLNLVNQDKGDIKYKISQFPDGQQTIDLECGRAFIQGKDIKIIARISI